MKNIVIVFLTLISSTLLGQEASYSSYFEPNGALRFDFFLAGNAQSQTAYFDAIYSEKVWGGNPDKTIEPYSYGEYAFRVYDKATNRLIFDKGFSSLFQEWRTTDEAKKVGRAFSQSIRIPVPKNPVKVEICERKKADGKLYPMFTMDVDPHSKFINHEKKQLNPVEEIVKSGDSEHKVDLVIVAEAYQQKEMGTFVNDAKRLVDTLFAYEPYKSNRDKFNVWLVESPSVDSGPDNPGANIWNSTVASSTFYTFDEERYLTTFDYKALADLTTDVPCDALYVLVNSSKYGGGGIYGYYALSSAHNVLSPKVFIHEFGHSFAGLGDEYFDSSTPYEDFYNLKVEPWEPNLTTLVNFDSKWKSMVEPGVPIPTPPTAEYKNKVGVFEGGGYMAKGIYRPMFDCRMRTNTAKGFCPVCQRAIQKVIDFYAQ